MNWTHLQRIEDGGIISICSSVSTPDRIATLVTTANSRGLRKTHVMFNHSLRYFLMYPSEWSSGLYSSSQRSAKAIIGSRARYLSTRRANLARILRPRRRSKPVTCATSIRSEKISGSSSSGISTEPVCFEVTFSLKS